MAAVQRTPAQRVVAAQVVRPAVAKAVVARAVVAQVRVAVVVKAVVKAAAPPPPGVQCANEHGTCTVPAGFVATVYYGKNGKWTSKGGMKGKVGCNNRVFGDPLWGTVKECRMVTQRAPAPPAPQPVRPAVQLPQRPQPVARPFSWATSSGSDDPHFNLFDGHIHDVMIWGWFTFVKSPVLNVQVYSSYCGYWGGPEDTPRPPTCIKRYVQILLLL